MMERRQRTIRGIDDDAWKLLAEVRMASRTEKGALVSEAIRFWYDNLAEEDQIEDGPYPVDDPLHDLAA